MHKLIFFFVRSLYNAFADQLKTRYNRDVTYKELRKSAAEHMRQHPDDFKPFLYLEDGNYDRYCDDIVNTACWGGQLEVKIPHSELNVPVTKLTILLDFGIG